MDLRITVLFFHMQQVSVIYKSKVIYLYNYYLKFHAYSSPSRAILNNFFLKKKGVQLYVTVFKFFKKRKPA